MRLPASFARLKVGSSIAARMAMMAMTTSSSISVNARPARFFVSRLLEIFCSLIFITIRHLMASEHTVRRAVSAPRYKIYDKKEPAANPFCNRAGRRLCGLVHGLVYARDSANFSHQPQPASEFPSWPGRRRDAALDFWRQPPVQVHRTQGRPTRRISNQPKRPAPLASRFRLELRAGEIFFLRPDDSRHEAGHRRNPSRITRDQHHLPSHHYRRQNQRSTRLLAKIIFSAPRFWFPPDGRPQNDFLKLPATAEFPFCIFPRPPDSADETDSRPADESATGPRPAE